MATGNTIYIAKVQSINQALYLLCLQGFALHIDSVKCMWWGECEEVDKHDIDLQVVWPQLVWHGTSNIQRNIAASSVSEWQISEGGAVVANQLSPMHHDSMQLICRLGTSLIWQIQRQKTKREKQIMFLTCPWGPWRPCCVRCPKEAERRWKRPCPVAPWLEWVTAGPYTWGQITTWWAYGLVIKACMNST